MVQSWPQNLPAPDESADKEFKVIQDLVVAIRAYRAEQKVPLDKVLTAAMEGKALDAPAVKLVEALRTKVKLVPKAEAGWCRLKLGELVLAIQIETTQQL